MPRWERVTYVILGVGIVTIWAFAVYVVLHSPGV
jgi:hypothetical protein